MAELTEYQRDVLIRTALGEARGEGVEGMADVVQVILNRANSGQYPSDPAKVAQQPYQFSTWNKGEGGNNPQQFKKSDAIYRKAEQALDMVLSGGRPDYTGGALFYHTPAVNPSWSREANRYGTVVRNGHIFYPSRPMPPGDIPNTVATQLDVRPQTRNVPLPTPRPAQSGYASTTPTVASNLASKAAPTYSATPRLADDGGIYQLSQRGVEPAQFVAGFGSPLQAPRSRQPDTTAMYKGIYGPQQVKLPPLPPSSVASPRIFDVTLQRAAEANRAPLAAALNTPKAAPPRTTTAQLREDTGQNRRPPPVPPYNAGTKIASISTRPAPLDADFGRLPSWDDFQTAFGPRQTPGPNAPAKGQERLVAGNWGVPSIATSLPALPGQGLGVGTALSVIPPLPQRRPVTGFPTSAGLRPMPSVAGFPTPYSYRPQASASAPLPRPRPNSITPIGRSIPTPAALRPTGRPPLQVVVDGAGTIYPSSSGNSGGGSSSSPGYVHNGQQVYATPTQRYNTDTNSFETVTTYKPRR